MSVLIAKMFSGSYRNSNLCHEVINLFTADDQKKYIYIPKYGKYTNGKMDEVTHVILITENGKTSNGNKQFDCIGMVEIDRNYPYNEWFIQNGNNTSNFTQKFVSDNSTITYGGRRLFYSDGKGGYNSDIFGKIVVNPFTFVAKSVYLFKKPFPVNDLVLPNSQNVLKKFGRQTKYYDWGEIIELKNRIDGLVKSKEFHYPTYSHSFGRNTLSNQTFLDILGKTYDEEIASSYLTYAFSKLPKLTVELFNKFSNGKIKLNEDFEVKKEFYVSNNSKYGFVDILIYEKDNLIVIENKINSSIEFINGKSQGKSQLDLYYEAFKGASLPKRTPKIDIDEELFEILKKKKNMYFIILKSDALTPDLTSALSKTASAKVWAPTGTNSDFLTYKYLFSFYDSKNELRNIMYLNNDEFVTFLKKNDSTVMEAQIAMFNK